MSKAFVARHQLTKQVIEVIERGYPYRATVQVVLPCSDNHSIDVLFVDFEVVGICQKPFFDIRPIEPIKIVISEEQMPRVFVLRSSFPPVPHLMVSNDGREKWLCYSDVADEELKLRMNGRFLIECINNWFIKTARNELHHPDQPLEPFFLGSEGVIVVDSSFMNRNNIFNKFIMKENNVLVQVDEGIGSDKADWYSTLWLCLPASADNIIRKVPSTLVELMQMIQSDEMQSVFVKQIQAIWMVRQNSQTYLSVFKQSVNSLLDCKCLIALYIPIKDDSTDTIKKHDIRIFSLEKPYSSLLEMAGYRYNNNPKIKKLEQIKNDKPSDIAIKLLQLHSSFESAFARELNGFESDYKNPQIAIIGVGALGSQVFCNCIRAGFGRWTLIDNDSIWSHNLARHSLGLDSLGKNKALELTYYAKTLIKDADVTAIADSIFNQDNEVTHEIFASADIILDISTSVAAARMLASDIKSEARRVSAFLNQSGTYLTMIAEDRERTISLDLLEMQTYKIMTKHEDYKDYFMYAGAMAYSAACRSITSRIPQDNVALSAAMVSKELKTLTAKEEAQITIWQLIDNSFFAHSYTPETWSKIKLGDWLFCINDSLLREMHLKRLERFPNETGGVLLGHCDFARNKLYIVDMVFSPEDSIESPTSYIRGCANLPEKMTEISKLTHNNLYYVGEWHSHPSGSTAMSGDDIKLLSAVTEWSDTECRLGCIIIVGFNNACSIHIKADSNLYISESIDNRSSPVKTQ